MGIEIEAGARRSDGLARVAYLEDVDYFMRNGRREVLAGLGLFLLGTLGLAAPPDPQLKRGGGTVRLTVEVTWTAAPALADGSGSTWS